VFCKGFGIVEDVAKKEVKIDVWGNVLPSTSRGKARY